MKSTLNQRDEQLVKAMQLLGDSTRYKMFKLMLDNNEFCVSEIANQLEVSTPAISQHFRIFELMGLVSKKRTGQKICYSLKHENKLVDDLTRLVAN